MDKNIKDRLNIFKRLKVAEEAEEELWSHMGDLFEIMSYIADKTDERREKVEKLLDRIDELCETRGDG